MGIDLIARQKLAAKQETDRLIQTIKNSVPKIPALDTTPISQSLENTNGVSEDQLTMSTMIYDKLDEISSLLVELNSKLGKEENGSEPNKETTA